MEEEQGRFTADDVVDGVAQKLVFRHPHVFGAAEAADSAQALEGWEAQKKKEKGFTSPADAVEAVPHTLPALWRAEKIVSRSVKAGFNWDSAAGALDKLDEETAELRQAVEAGQPVDSPHGIREVFFHLHVHHLATELHSLIFLSIVPQPVPAYPN